MNKKAALFTALVLTISLAAGSLYLVSAQTEADEETDFQPFFGGFRGGMNNPMVGSLDEELRAEMQEHMQLLKEEGATREEIHEYVQGFLEENGVESVMPEMSEEQLEALQQLHEDVQEYAMKRAEELGIELPEEGFPGIRGMKPRGPMRGCRFVGKQQS